MKHAWCVLVAFVCAAPIVLGGAALPRSLYRVETMAGSGRNGDGGPALTAQMGNIQGIAFDLHGNLYLSDTDNHRVRKVDAAGVITTVAGTGQAGYTGDDGPATAARLNLPYGLAVDRAGSIYVADLGNNRVRRIDPGGTIRTFAGTGAHGTSGDNGPATAAPLLPPGTWRWTRRATCTSRSSKDIACGGSPRAASSRLSRARE